MQPLQRLNLIASSLGITPDEALDTMIQVFERKLPEIIAVMPEKAAEPQIKRRRRWSAAARKRQSERMKQLIADKRAAAKRRKGGVKELTPEHKEKLRAGYLKFRESLNA